MIMTVNKEMFNVTEDTVLAACTGTDNSGNAVNYLTDERYNWDGTLTTAHNPLTVERGFKITSITLTSGEIIMY